MKKPVAVITGASRGIGRGIAIELSKSHNIVATYRGRLDAAESLAAETSAAIFQCDVGSAQDREALLRFTREKFGRLDLLVNNAGIAPKVRLDILEATGESFDELINTNLKGPHFLTQAAARWMLEQGSGRIVFITSLSAYAATVMRSDYCMSKAALAMFARGLALRLADQGISVFEVRPGIIRTEMTSGVTAKYDQAIAEGVVPERRWGEPDDIGSIVAALAGGAFPYSTGTVIDAGGGLTIPKL